MNNVRLLAFSLMVAFGVIALSSVNPASAAKPDCETEPSHPSCKDDGGGASEDNATYSFFLQGDVGGGSGDDVWIEQSKGIHRNVFTGSTGPTRTTIDFVSFSPFPLESCFASVKFYPKSGTIKKTHKNMTEAWFWFTAETKHIGVSAKYVFRSFGTFAVPDPTWLPAGEVTTTSMTMKYWVIRLENGQPELESTACIGEGDFEAGYNIDVHLNPVP